MANINISRGSGLDTRFAPALSQGIDARLPLAALAPGNLIANTPNPITGLRQGLLEGYNIARQRKLDELTTQKIELTQQAQAQAAERADLANRIALGNFQEAQRKARMPRWTKVEVTDEDGWVQPMMIDADAPGDETKHVPVGKPIPPKTESAIDPGSGKRVFATEADKARGKAIPAEKPETGDRYTFVKGPDGKVVSKRMSEVQPGETPYAPPVAPRPSGIMPTALVEKLTNRGTAAVAMAGAADTFDDSYGSLGAGDNTTARAQLWTERQSLPFGIKKPTSRATWWQNYDALTNVARKELFGTALTAVEAGKFERANIEPGMKPEVIRANLAIQKAAAVEAARKLAQAEVIQGYNKDAIEHALGFKLGEWIHPDPNPGAAAQRLLPSTLTNMGMVGEKPPVSVTGRSDPAFINLAPGEKFIVNGRVGTKK